MKRCRVEHLSFTR